MFPTISFVNMSLSDINHSMIHFCLSVQYPRVQKPVQFFGISARDFLLFGENEAASVAGSDMCKIADRVST